MIERGFNEQLGVGSVLKPDKQTTCSLMTKLWALGFILEPFLYFVLFDRTQAGVTIGIARAFQLLFLLYLSLHLLSGRALLISQKASKILKPIYLFFIGTIFYALILLSIKTIMNIDLIKDYSSFSDLLNGLYFRPYLEIAILSYQLIYFIVMPSIMLRTKADFDFLFRVSSVLLILHFSLGWVDYILSGTGFDLLARHFHDGIFVGQRFHGLAGEPRDAAVLILSLFLFYAIYSFYRHGQVRSFSLPLNALLIVSLIATFSASGMLAIIFGSILYVVYGAKELKIKNLFNYLLILLSIAIIFAASFWFSGRVLVYYDLYSSLIFELIADPFQDLPRIVLSSYNNFFPIIMMFNDIMSGNILVLLFGYGLGSSGQVNALIYSEYLNPNSQIIRFLYEFGLVGTLIFIYSLFYVVRRATQSFSVIDAKRIKLYLIIALGAFFAHRGYSVYMWVGLLVSVVNYRLYYLKP